MLHETQGHHDEALMNAKYCYEQNIPYIISFLIDKDGNLLDGYPIQKMIDDVLAFEPLAIGFNCILSNVMEKVLKTVDLKSLVWGFYLNCGDEEKMKSYRFGQSNQLTEDTHELSPALLIQWIKDHNLMELQPAFIGTCCMSDVQHTQEIGRASL